MCAPEVLATHTAWLFGAHRSPSLPLTPFMAPGFAWQIVHIPSISNFLESPEPFRIHCYSFILHQSPSESLALLHTVSPSDTSLKVWVLVPLTPSFAFCIPIKPAICEWCLDLPSTSSNSSLSHLNHDHGSFWMPGWLEMMNTVLDISGPVTLPWVLFSKVGF